MNKLKYILATFLIAGIMASCSKDDFTGDSQLTPSNPTITVTAPATVPALESGNTFEFVVTLSEPQIVDVAVHVTVTDGDATEGEDFVINNSGGVLVIPAYRTSGKVSVTVKYDVEPEPDETFTIQIGDDRTANATITPVEVDFTIENVTEDEMPMVLSFDAEVYDITGEKLDGSDFAALGMYLIDENGVIVDQVEALGYPEMLIESTLPDGEYTIAADLIGLIDAGDLGEIPLLDVFLDYSQVGVLSATTIEHPASFIPAPAACAQGAFVVATFTKVGAVYTVVQGGGYVTYDATGFVGLYDTDEPGYGVYTVELTGAASANTLMTDNFWDSGWTVPIVLDACGGAIYATTEVDPPPAGGTVYVIASTSLGTYDVATHTIVLPYKVTRKSDGAVFDNNTHTYVMQ